MLSNDQNVETIGCLVDIYKHYIGFQIEYVKLDVIEKVVRLITVITLVATLPIITILALIYMSFTAAYALEPHVGLPIGFLVVTGGHSFIFLLFLFFRKQWIERPFARFLASLLMEKRHDR